MRIRDTGLDDEMGCRERDSHKTYLRPQSLMPQVVALVNGECKIDLDKPTHAVGCFGIHPLSCLGYLYVP